MRVFHSGRVVVLLVPVLTCAAVAAVSAPAHARTSVALSGVVTPAITGFPTTPQNVRLTMEGRVVGDDIDDQYPATTRRIVLWFTHGARVNGSWFPSCRARLLAALRGAPRACPRGSKIGSGWAFGTAISVTARLRMDVYNSRGGHSMLFYFSADNPVLIRELIDAPFDQLRGGRYGFRLTLPVPDGLQELTDGMVTSLRQFRATVGGMTATRRVHGRAERRGFIEAMTCPPGALVVVRGEFSFRTIAPVTSDAFLGCGQAPPFPPGFPPSVTGSA
ncbi:hypothetical protein [Conexibacter sp. CPCC 206217]|uniref:hypothetical protein n=1 Tax=Conexibacter sp. CPCC 206217 TaxID=3064574 RepID=UPI002723B259|nr:hypothetical protein [Conexibacter sp. CPCC 206217]MDO8209863.1 hypothetical protein [Conexibacter sp. CPCC 206217]